MTTIVIPKNKFIVGILGPKSYFLGGHDDDNVIRKPVINTISRILTDLQSEYSNLMGLTGLDLGTDQDFAKLCLRFGIPFFCLVSHENQNKLWGGLDSGPINDMKELLGAAFGTKLLSEGNFSPKKITSKKLTIIQNSNVLIYVKPPGLSDCDMYLEEINNLGKTVYLIKT